ncbi:AraC family transcriptional regulator [Pseudomonas sp. BCA14]|uniref:helix-turn-helix domain-containing protein n=1 Tax=unclassified Pseudomonas TaxID=196821 RepID=UPI00106EE975|nr:MULTISPECIES: AraC family transcriptional regulator [unclassified Pseudomonas]TFF02625.1 AraC family transcriptional regulator [Pseudomonas sp. JMN1]TFF06990.1 AraC family transcriptional regulator [Pseudomonas sp. BCA17]TFF24282.1 AraC family transcriptional regulator [Pseudomonas sp. BCA13]TFF24429.1 AraC family transcriptional regulator [Pseudomonas sp. BCA14]
MAQPAAAPGTLCPQREKRVRQLILANLSGPLEVTELARACDLSRSHFSRAFKRTIGVAPQEWIRQQRIKQAKVLISITALSLTQISQECGFCDQAHFCHLFSRSEGINPMTWRRLQLRYRDHLRAVQRAIVNSNGTVIQNSAS